MIDICGGFKVIVNPDKIVEAIAYGNETGNRSLSGFLYNNELLNRVIANEPYMGVSIKILHALFH